MTVGMALLYANRSTTYNHMKDHVIDCANKYSRKSFSLILINCAPKAGVEIHIELRINPLA